MSKAIDREKVERILEAIQFAGAFDVDNSVNMLHWINSDIDFDNPDVGEKEAVCFQFTDDDLDGSEYIFTVSDLSNAIYTSPAHKHISLPSYGSDELIDLHIYNLQEVDVFADKDAAAEPQKPVVLHIQLGGSDEVFAYDAADGKGFQVTASVDHNENDDPTNLMEAFNAMVNKLGIETRNINVSLSELNPELVDEWSWNDFLPIAVDKYRAGDFDQSDDLNVPSKSSELSM